MGNNMPSTPLMRNGLSKCQLILGNKMVPKDVPTSD